MEGASSSGDSEAVIQTLIQRGWCFGDSARVQALISLQFVLQGDFCTVDLIESELANMDLRSIGGKSLPDISLLRNSTRLAGPKVLQVASVKDISRSSIDDNLGNSHKRLLRLNLTDGHSEITAIEYSHVPSIASDIVPGTKVLLENKAPMHCGIVCLNPKVITVLGGVVQSLYEEWQMNQKYSGFSRSSLRTSKERDADCGPPPFEKLQISSISRPAIQLRDNQWTASTSKSYRPPPRRKEPRYYPNPIGNLHEPDPKVDNLRHDGNGASNAKQTEESASNSETRTREVDNLWHDRNGTSNAKQTEESASNSEIRTIQVVEAVPVQNQAAAQKLLQKMSQPNREFHSRGRKYKGKGREEDAPVWTLDEYERSKAGVNPSGRDPFPYVSQDEDLAQHLQNQFDLEDYHVQQGQGGSEAERLKMSIFNFQRNYDQGNGGESFRGRGRGKERRRGRWRGY